MRILIAGGGTGGHIYPALAVARSLHARPDAPELAWLGGHRGLEASLVPPTGIPLQRLVLRSLRTTEADVHAVTDPLRLGASVPQAAAILAAQRPAAVFTTGGYMAVPVLMAAAPLGIPVVLWDGNVIPGRAVRATARLATALAVSFEATCEALSKAAPGGRATSPARPSATPAMSTARRLAHDSRSMRPSGSCSSSGARRRSAGSTPPCPTRCRDSSSGSRSSTSRARTATRPPWPSARPCPKSVRGRYRPYPFLRDEMLSALAAADLVVGRAGSSTLAEVTALGLPMIVVPYPHAGGHQRANAKVLTDAGAARSVEDADLDATTLLDAAAILDDPVAHLAMSAAARALGRPGAADAVTDLVLAAARREPLPDPAVIERRSSGRAA